MSVASRLMYSVSWFDCPCTPRLNWTAVVVVAVEPEAPAAADPPPALTPAAPPTGWAADVPPAAAPAEPPLPPEPDEELVGSGMVGARLKRTSLAIRFRSVRTSRECST